MTELDGCKSEVTAAGEAMQHRGESTLPALFLQSLRHIGVAFARMNHQRQAGFACRCDVLAEAGSLCVARAGIAKVIEPSLADRDHFWMLCNADKYFGVDIQLFMGMIWMCAHGAKYFWKSFGDGQNLRVAFDPC
jgi:hypothetical protein